SSGGGRYVDLELLLPPTVGQEGQPLSIGRPAERVLHAGRLVPGEPTCFPGRGTQVRDKNGRRNGGLPILRSGGLDPGHTFAVGGEGGFPKVAYLRQPPLSLPGRDAGGNEEH